MSNTMQVRVDAKTKKAVSAIFNNLGLDLSTGVKIYFSQVLRHGGIPFPVVTENGFTPAEEDKIVREIKQTRALYKRGRGRSYSSVKEMFKDILA